MLIIIARQDRVEPYVILFKSTDNLQYGVVIEKALLFTTELLDEAIGCLVAIYFVFNIIYPKAFEHFLQFLQHAVFNLLDDQVKPTSLTTFLTCLS